MFGQNLLPYFLESLSVQNAVAYSAVSFVLFHIITVFAGSDLKAVLIQVVMTMILGFCFGYLYVFAQKISWCAIDHGLWDDLVINEW